MKLNELRDEVGTWARSNFGPGTEGGYHALLGMVEEMGELSHHHLKQLQNIRKNEDHEEGIKDAIGDILIYMADYASMRGYDLDKILDDTWNEIVKKRDWKLNSTDGKVAPTPVPADHTCCNCEKE